MPLGVLYEAMLQKCESGCPDNCRFDNWIEINAGTSKYGQAIHTNGDMIGDHNMMGTGAGHSHKWAHDWRSQYDGYWPHEGCAAWTMISHPQW